MDTEFVRFRYHPGEDTVNKLVGCLGSQGFSLINILIALLIFTFGMLSLAAAYLRINASVDDNEYFISAGVMAESMRSTLAASPALLVYMNNFSTATRYNNNLVDWTSQLIEALPGASATATAIAPVGGNCTAVPPCTVTLVINWQKKVAHSQAFVIQVGY